MPRARKNRTLPSRKLDDEIKKGKIFLAYSKQANSWLRESNNNISSKFSDIIKLNTSILTVLFGLTYFIAKSVSHTEVEPILSLLIPSFVLFFFALVVSVIYYRPFSFDFSNPEILINELKGKTYEKALAGAAATLARQVSNNLRTTNNRSWGLDVAVFLTVISFVPLGMAVFLLAYVLHL